MAPTDEETSDRRLTVPADLAHLAQVRHHVADAASRGGASDEIVEQLQLVVSELVTNAVQYDDAQSVTVSVRSDSDGWTIDVSNAEGLVDLAGTSPAPPTSLSGRGLFIVDAIMDRVEVVDLDGTHHVRCVKFAE